MGRTISNAISAGIWGLVSAFSLLIGALVGVSFKVSDKFNGLIMAFGAGALLFAVAIEMFAAGIREMEEEEDATSMEILVVSSIVGAIFYTMVNKWLTGGKHTSVTAGIKKEEREERESMGRPEEEEENERKNKLKNGDGYDKVSAEDGEDDVKSEEEGNNVAFSIWLGILIDGVPESMLIGFMQSEGALSVAFIVAVFLANFPEAMSSAALMYRNGDSITKIICMWNILFLGTGFIAFLTALIFPGKCHTEGKEGVRVCEFPVFVNFLASASEGLAGGSMMACISTAMLPEAFELGGDYAGLTTLMGFIASLFVKLTMEKKESPGAICATMCPNEDIKRFLM